MTGRYETSDKAKEWAKHLKPAGKRLANKSTRGLGRRACREAEKDYR